MEREYGLKIETVDKYWVIIGLITQGKKKWEGPIIGPFPTWQDADTAMIQLATGELDGELFRKLSEVCFALSAADYADYEHFEYWSELGFRLRLSWWIEKWDQHAHVVKKARRSG